MSPRGIAVNMAVALWAADHCPARRTRTQSRTPMRTAHLSGRRRSVEEVPLPGEVHRDAGRCGRGDHVLVADGAARLDDRPHAGGDEDLGAVGEREERVRGGDGAGGAVTGTS